MDCAVDPDDIPSCVTVVPPLFISRVPQAQGEAMNMVALDLAAIGGADGAGSSATTDAATLRKRI